MYIPHYINAALPKTMSRTQQVRHTVKSFRIFSLLTTIAAVMCDWTQLNYYTQLSLNDTFWGGVSVSIIVVLWLDVSMFFLGTVLNQYRKATGTTKGNFRFIGIGLLVTFLIAYVVYLLMAIPVLSQQASDGDVPFYGRLLIPIASSALAFFTSVGWDPKGEQIQRLLDEKLKISSDISEIVFVIREHSFSAQIYFVDSLYFIRSRVGNECGEKKLQMQPQNRRNIPLQICLFQSRQQNICACNLN